jgi:hypothetical protein
MVANPEMRNTIREMGKDLRLRTSMMEAVE